MPEGSDKNSGSAPNWPVGQDAQRGEAETLFNQGLDQHDQGLYDEAIESYKRAIELDPAFVVANNNLGMVYIDKEMFPEALAALERTIELDPGYAEAYNNLGFVYRRLGEEAKAAAHYAKFIELEPDVEDAAKIQSWLDKVRVDEEEAPPGGDPGEPAAEPAESAPAAEATPAPADPWVDKAEPGPQAAGAGPPSRPSQQAVAPPPSAPPAASGASAQPTGASASKVAGPPAETAEAVCEKGIAEFEAGKLKEAEATLRRAATMKPALAVARSALGRALAKLDRYDEAVEELKAAVSLDPTDAAAYYVLGFALRSSRQDHEAADAYERYLDLTPDAGEGPQIRSWIAETRSAPQLTSEELYHRALTSFQDGALDDALEACESALGMDETAPEANILMGRILIEKGDYIRAVAVLRRAERRNPDSPEVHFYLGQAYEKRSLMDEARQAYERCLVVAPAGPQAEAVRSWLEKARGPGKKAASPEARCEYCFRGFPARDLSTHEGKRICPDCLKNLGVAHGPAPAARVIEHTGVERVAAAEAIRAQRRRLGARIFRWALTGVLALFLVLGLLLLSLRSGWLEGPFQSIGLYGAIRALGLEQALKRIGIHLPKKTDPGQLPPGGRDGTTLGGGGVPTPVAKRLVLKGPEGTVAAMPLAPFELTLRAEGSRGAYRFSKVSGPKDLKVDLASGAVSWRPLAGAEKLDLPSTHEVEVEVTAGGERAKAKFEIVVNIGFEPGLEIDAGIGPGKHVFLAVGPLDVPQGRGRDAAPRANAPDIAVAWGRYREGFLKLFYRKETGGEFRSAPPVPLGGQPSALVLADFTGDGRTDAAVANWYSSRLHLFRQDEEGALVPDGTLPTARGVSGVTAGDVDGDGKTDLLATHWSESKLHVYLQQKEDAKWRLASPAEHDTDTPSGWNRIFVGPLRGGPRGVYLLCGSGSADEEKMFKVFPVLGNGKLRSYYGVPKSAAQILKKLGERPLDAHEIRSGDGDPCIAALVGGKKGETPALYIIGAKGDDLEIVSKPEIVLARHPVSMAVADLNRDGADDLAVLYPEKIGVYLSAGPPGPGADDPGAGWGPYHAVAMVEIKGAVGPVTFGRLSGDEVPDLLVACEDGKLQIVRAFVGRSPGARARLPAGGPSKGAGEGGP